MATTKISKGKTFNIKITNKSKDTTYVFKNEKTAKKAVLNLTSNAVTSDFVKDGNDLLITSTFGNYSDGSLKVVLTTIKDYYKYSAYNSNLVKYNNNNYFLTYSTKGGTISDDGQPDGINEVGNSSNTRYDLTDVGYFDNNGGTYGNYFDTIRDVGGNDKYEIDVKRQISSYNGKYYYSSRNGVISEDYSGNDTYDISDHSYFVGTDYSGNDKYSLYTGTMEVVDLSGDDDYSISDAYFSKSLSNSYFSKIDDFKGNDNYDIEKSYFTVKDRAGNDNYDIANSPSASSSYYSFIEDQAGKDTYNLYNVRRVYVTDGYFEKSKSGNDVYTVSSSAYFVVEDGSGNDVYDFNSSYGFNILDGNAEWATIASGNDKYKLTASWDSDISDLEGKDNYELKNCDSLTIYDGYVNGSGKVFGGNDTYEATKLQDSEIYDYSGKNTYKLSRSTDVGIRSGFQYSTTKYSGGNDKYLLDDCTNVGIIDYGGKDEYKFEDVEYVEVRDYSGDDKYTVTNSGYNGYSGYYGIYDSKGNDKYTVSDVEYQIISDSEGKDSYTITDSQFYIVDKGESKDTYKLGTLTGHSYLEDYGGKDTLTLASGAKNLIFMADFKGNNYGNGIGSDSLYIIDTNTYGIVEIEDYFTRTQNSNTGKYQISGKGAGCIETIKAGKKNITSYASQNTINSLASVIGSWIDGNVSTYGSVSNLLYNGKESEIAEFIEFAKNPNANILT